MARLRRTFFSVGLFKCTQLEMALFEVPDRHIRDTGMSWDKCVGICTDRARSMTGRVSGLVTRVQHLAPLVDPLYDSP